MLFDECVYLYIEAKSEGRKAVRPNTLEGYLSAIKCHLMPKWTGREVESITADELQDWVDSFAALLKDAQKQFGRMVVAAA